MIIDDESMIRRGLRLLVNDCPDFEVVGEAGCGMEALEIVARQRPDVILLDVNLRGENGLDLMPRLHEASPDSAVLVLTGEISTDAYLKSMRLGAMGLILKDKEPEELHRAIEKVHRGEAWFDRVLQGRLQQERARPADHNDEESARVGKLTKRQREVLAVLGEGLPNKKIAERLGISDGTVKRHLEDITNKLGAADRYELIILAYRHRLARPPH
jgi:DNA-binding NarL/FixJ family response regulator